MGNCAWLHLILHWYVCRICETLAKHKSHHISLWDMHKSTHTTVNEHWLIQTLSDKNILSHCAGQMVEMKMYLAGLSSEVSPCMTQYKETCAQPYLYHWWRGQGNSIMVSISVCQAGHPGSRPVHSVLFRKVVRCQNVMNLSPPVLTTGSPEAVHVLSCLCDNACKRSLAICRKSRALCPVSRLLSVPV